MFFNSLLWATCFLIGLTPSFGDDSVLFGTWHINDKGYPLQTGTTLSRSTLLISYDEISQHLSARFWDESWNEYSINITKNEEINSFYLNNTILFNFCTQKNSDNNIAIHCYEGKVFEGIMTGHQCISSINGFNCSQNNETEILPFSGWNHLYLNNNILLRNKYNNLPQDYLLTLQNVSAKKENNSFYNAHLRIDYNLTSNEYIGRFKIFYDFNNSAKDHGEELEYDIKINEWNGTYITFIRYINDSGNDYIQKYTANIVDYTNFDELLISSNLLGVYTDSRYPNKNGQFTGMRWNVLNSGLISSYYDPNAYKSYQGTVRNQLKFLMMFGNPDPLSIDYELNETPVNGSNGGSDRDDDWINYPENYTIYNGHFTFNIPNWYKTEGVTITRNAHGYIAIPNNISNPHNMPLLVAVNGHGGSSWQIMWPGTNSNDIYWYGNAFARRHDYIVLAIDISHRNNTPLYHDHFYNGDDPQHGNGAHPPIIINKNYNFSDWEEDGERSWDVYHLTKWLINNINTLNITDLNENITFNKSETYITGLSMGGEITTIVGALFGDELYHGGVIPAGFSPDLDVMYDHGNHPCWRWTNSNIREYIDTSTLHSLIDSNILVVMTGQNDYTYSARHPPYSADKQILRRSREYHLKDYKNENNIYNTFDINVYHYLHFDVHRWHCGDIDYSQPNLTHLYVQIPQKIKPLYFNDNSWQITKNVHSVISPMNNTEGLNLFELFKYYRKNKNN